MPESAPAVVALVMTLRELHNGEDMWPPERRRKLPKLAGEICRSSGKRGQGQSSGDGVARLSNRADDIWVRQLCNRERDREIKSVQADGGFFPFLLWCTAVVADRRSNAQRV